MILTLCANKKRRCHAFSKTAVDPEVIEQLRVWPAELAEEGRSGTVAARAGGEETIVSV